jgi:hypothetical protein
MESSTNENFGTKKMLFYASKRVKNIVYGFLSQFCKLGHAAKLAMQVDSSNFSHPKSIDIHEKLYIDPIHINEFFPQGPFPFSRSCSWFFPHCVLSPF